LSARSIPFCTASSKLVFDEELISVTFATDMVFSLAIVGCALARLTTDERNASRPSRFFVTKTREA
jgi:hypothetical protein